MDGRSGPKGLLSPFDSDILTFISPTLPEGPPMLRSAQLLEDTCFSLISVPERMRGETDGSTGGSQPSEGGGGDKEGQVVRGS